MSKSKPSTSWEGGEIMAKQNQRQQKHRSAVTGRYVKASTAKRNPRTTVSETVKRRK